MKLHIDGILKDVVSVSSAISNFDGNRLFLGSAGNAVSPMIGKIAEAILYTGKPGCKLDHAPEMYLKEKYNL
jgi:hypothetical protein